MLPTRVILVRHGRSTFNEQGRYQGSSDTAELTESGMIAARQVGKALRDVAIDALYVSPLKRVQQTVDSILQGMEREIPSIHTCSLLREIDLPAWEGMPFKTVREEYAADYRCWKLRPHEFQMVEPSGYHAAHGATALATRPRYPVLDLYDRAQQFWQDVLPRHAGQTLLIVSHGGTNHALISQAIGLPAAQHHCLQQSNCGISELIFTHPDRPATLTAMNLTHSLGESLPKLKEGKQGIRLILLPSGDISPTLVDAMRDIAIDFSISSDAAQVNLQKVLQNHPQAVQLHIASDDSLLGWQQALANHSASESHPAPLVTGLVMAETSVLQQFIAKTLAFPQTHYPRISLCFNTLTVLHYPAIEHFPILQSLNFHLPLRSI
ncbi:MAG: histidine phosphatase family protein [Drouetiella hepatica Uher 2000/2452]|jgi:probable phosphoglycerate mutase|uniref:Histidine phosphatase family protein n=1 Tax=Drouetiella hepatica Uher 2000/2452 TaxID=904376 RepID=A0A951QFP1_9CYAN|nr:histidine phosphatase family protein [Drouetiella hepatica Uher 2000/2452]